MPIPRHYSYGPRKLNIILTKLRCNASFLNYDLCKVKILSNASCNCGAPCDIEIELRIAFLNLDSVSRLRTERLRLFHSLTVATDNREIIFNSLNWLPSNINIDVNLLTKGSDLLTYVENITIFKHAFKYIKDSKREAVLELYLVF
jgi:hypothetical protein